MSYISAIRKGDDVIVWERTAEGRTETFFKAPYYFYTKHPDGEYKTMYGDSVTKHEFSNSFQFKEEIKKFKREGVPLFESDISPELKILSREYYDLPSPNLHISFFDIEVDFDIKIGFSTIDNPYAPINSISIYHQYKNKYVVLAVPPPDQQWTVERLEREVNSKVPLPKDMELDIQLFSREKHLLLAFLAEIKDSDIISGWNSSFFDMPYVAKRLEKLGKRYVNLLSFPGSRPPRYRTVEKFKTDHQVVDIYGRVSLDYLDLFRKYEMSERPSYKLEIISDEFLPNLPKLKYEGSLAQLYQKDFAYFVRYNIRDTEILHGFEQTLGYVNLANDMVHLSTAQFTHVGGTLKLAELAVINYCHHKLNNLVVNDFHADEEASSQIQGAFVLLPQIGLQEKIGSVDINSLYPSSIRSINISIETIIGQFENNVVDADNIALNTDKECTFYLDDGDKIKLPASKWRTLLLKKKWAISGYGTVFNQEKQGIIPMILEDWYATRNEYKKLMKQAKDNGEDNKVSYYDRLQYVFKIKLNSFYGALTNKFFRFYDLRMGESTTGTGRQILLHQCAKACEILDGEYSLPDIKKVKTKQGRYEDPKTAKTNDGRMHLGYSKKHSIVYGDSVGGKTIIETDEGPTTIEDLFDDVNYSIGDKEYSNTERMALTYVNDSKNNEFRKIKYVMRHKTNKQRYRVWFGNTRFLDVTEDHALIGYANSKHATPGLIEIKPTEIGSNNVNSLLLTSSLPQIKKQNPFQLSPEMWQLIGFIIGDGHVEKRVCSGVGLSLGKDDKHEIIQKMIKPLIHQGWFTSYIEMKNGHDIRLCGVKGYYFLKKHLYGKGEKRFPTWIEQCYITDICNVLKGYFSADGFANKNNTVGLCSINPHFIYTANRLLKLCGIPSNFWAETTENSFRGVYSGTHTIRLTVYDSVKFGEIVGFIQQRKNNNIKKVRGFNQIHQEEQSGFTLITPTKIEKILNDGYVYDIEIDDTHTFYANDILVHNTDSTYFSTHTASNKEAIMVADKVGELINESFPKFMRERFLCTEGYDQIIKTGREVVSDRGIFVDKKRYILHLIDSDGYKVDKMKIMGLDTKKTTLPKEISNILNGYIERYLKGEDWETIEKEIVEFKDMLYETNDIMMLGLPKGVQNVKAYTEKMNCDSSATIPGHVRAAINYNNSLKKFNDHESMTITSGTKIKVFYIKNVVGKFKSIALPVDIDVIPAWFEKEFSIDRDAHIERLVDNPLNNIIKAIGKVTPSKQSLSDNSILVY